jgi:hypothetical protein
VRYRFILGGAEYSSLVEVTGMLCTGYFHTRGCHGNTHILSHMIGALRAHWIAFVR